MEIIRNYFNKTKYYKSFRLILEFPLVSLCSSFMLILPVVAISVVTGKVSQQSQIAILLGNDPREKIFYAIFVAPPFETFLAQWLPIRFLFSRVHNKSLLIVMPVFIFLMMHSNLRPGGLLFFLPGAIMLTWSMLVYWEKSKWIAFWITSGIHLLMNIYLLLIYFGLGKILHAN